MKFIKIAFLLVIVNFSLTSWANDCPVSQGETEANACALEQAMVEAAKKDLKPFIMWKYCGQNPGKDYACRALVRYENEKQEMSEDIFEEWFILPDPEKPVQWRGFFVKGEGGSYDLFWSDAKGSPLEAAPVVSADPNQTDISVEFDRYFPSFKLVYNNIDPNIPPVLSQYRYSMGEIEIEKYNDVAGEDGVIKKETIEVLKYQLEEVSFY